MCKNPEKYFTDSSIIGGSQEITIKKKSDNITPQNSLILMLSQIPSVSYKTANAISDVCGGNMISMIGKLHEFPTCIERMKYISNIEIYNGDKKRRVGESSAKKIIEHLYGYYEE